MTSAPPPERDGWLGEALSRLAQLMVRGRIFDAPVLLSVRHMVLRRLFDIDRQALIGAHFYFIRPHGFKRGYLKVGGGSKINHNVEIDYSGGVEIGRDVWISQNVLIERHEHVVGAGPKEDWQIELSPLKVEDEAWIGANAIILPGVTRIGVGAIVAAGAVVTRDVEEWTVVAGAPAKKIGMRPPINMGVRG